VLDFIQHPLGYFLVMIPIFSVLSLPLEPTTLMIAKVAPPWEIALLGAAAAGVAAVFDYFFVRRVFRIGALDRLRGHRLFSRVERYAKVAPFLTILAFAALPLPFAIPRVMMPLIGYSLPRYVTATALGRLPRIYVLAAFGKIFDIPNWILAAFLIGAVALAALGALFRKLGWIGKATAVAAAPLVEAARPSAPPPPA
jgi:uncharacterized membrane protein YdjX (TVP38/TMEM64 family)